MAEMVKSKVELMRAGSWVNCRVTDNGSRLGRIKLGRGLRIVGELASSLGGRIDRTSGAIRNSFSLDFPLTKREQRANRAVAGRRPRTVSSIEAPAGAASLARGGRASAKPSPSNKTSRSKDIHYVEKDLLMLSVSVLLGVALVAPSAALAQFGPPPVRRQPSLVLLPASVPVVLLRAWAPAALPSVARRPDPPLRFRRVPRGRTSARRRRWSASSRWCWRIAGSRPRRPGQLFAASRVAARPTAPTATPAIVTTAMAMDVATGTGRYAAAAAAYAYGRSYGSSDDGCYYVSDLQAIRRQAHSGL